MVLALRDNSCSPIFKILIKVSEPQEEDQSQTNRNVCNQERLDKDRSYENSVVNTNVDNQEMLDKDYYENSYENDSAGPWEQRPRK